MTKQTTTTVQEWVPALQQFVDREVPLIDPRCAMCGNRQEDGCGYCNADMDEAGPDESAYCDNCLTHVSDRQHGEGCDDCRAADRAAREAE